MYRGSWELLKIISAKPQTLDISPLNALIKKAAQKLNCE